MPNNTLMYAMKKPSSAYVALSAAVVMVGAAVGISASSFQRGKTSSDTRLTQESFRVRVSRKKTMTMKSTSVQNSDVNTAETHRVNKFFRWRNSAGTKLSRKVTAATASVQYVPAMLKTYKHSIDFDSHRK
jgi:hypothetical protein